jgi:predicted nucleotidyltransferase component of viral defense system
MIKKESLGSSWIAAISKEKKADPTLVEKVVQALWLLEGLVQSGLPFVFKGGTALMLKLGSNRRLSIDIDIIITKKEEQLTALLNSVGAERGFIKVEEQIRATKSKIDKAHYRFYYAAAIQNAELSYVLLDILFGESGYQKIEKQLVESSFLQLSEKPSIVSVPF